MKLLITGVPGVTKDTVLKLVMERLRAVLPNLVWLKFDDLIPKIEERLEIYKKLQASVFENIQLRMLKAEVKKEHVMINGYCVMKTKLGYVPLMTEKMIKILKPDVLINLEVDPRTLTKNPAQINAFKLQQDIERNYASLYASLSGAMLKLIQVKIDGEMEAAKEIVELVKILK